VCFRGNRLPEVFGGMTIVFTDSTGEPSRGDPGGWQSWPTDPRMHPPRHERRMPLHHEENKLAHTGEAECLICRRKEEAPGLSGVEIPGPAGEIEAGGKSSCAEAASRTIGLPAGRAYALSGKLAQLVGRRH